jgi:hypothetical protein
MAKGVGFYTQHSVGFLVLPTRHTCKQRAPIKASRFINFFLLLYPPSTCALRYAPRVACRSSLSSSCSSFVTDMLMLLLLCFTCTVEKETAKEA